MRRAGCRQATGAKGCRRRWERGKVGSADNNSGGSGRAGRHDYVPQQKESSAADAGSSRLNPMNIDIVDRRLCGRKAGVCLSKSNSDVKPLW